MRESYTLSEINSHQGIAAPALRTPHPYQPIVKFPTFEFDAAFTVDKAIRAGDLAKQIKETAGEILQSVSVFDVYEGENLGADKKSIAFRLTFLDSNKTINHICYVK